MNNPINPADALLLPPDHSIIVTSGETSDDQYDDDDDDDSNDSTGVEQPNLVYGHDFYDHRADDEDEVYVYQHLRSGVKEQVSDQRDGEKQLSGGIGSQHHDTMKVYKPRKSDAILSCPSCFNIVCMDCQRHERYANQFRAMFVMGIAVRWDLSMVYDDSVQGLVPYPTTSPASTTTTTKFPPPLAPRKQFITLSAVQTVKPLWPRWI